MNGWQIDRNPFEVAVRFSGDDLCAMRQEAARRQSPKNDNPHARDNRIAGLGNVQMHLVGLLGEHAVARLIHQPVETTPTVAGNRVSDFSLHGVTVEVKTLRGYLTFPTPTAFRADVAALVIYDPWHLDTVWVQGWTDRQGFAEASFEADFGHGPRRCVQPADLHAISTLSAYCLVQRSLREALNQGREWTPRLVGRPTQS